MKQKPGQKTTPKKSKIKLVKANKKRLLIGATIGIIVAGTIVAIAVPLAISKNSSGTSHQQLANDVLAMFKAKKFKAKINKTQNMVGKKNDKLDFVKIFDVISNDHDTELNVPEEHKKNLRFVFSIVDIDDDAAKINLKIASKENDQKIENDSVQFEITDLTDRLNYYADKVESVDVADAIRSKLPYTENTHVGEYNIPEKVTITKEKYGNKSIVAYIERSFTNDARSGKIEFTYKIRASDNQGLLNTTTFKSGSLLGFKQEITNEEKFNIVKNFLEEKPSYTLSNKSSVNPSDFTNSEFIKELLKMYKLGNKNLAWVDEVNFSLVGEVSSGNGAVAGSVDVVINGQTWTHQSKKITFRGFKLATDINNENVSTAKKDFISAVEDLKKRSGNDAIKVIKDEDTVRFNVGQNIDFPADGDSKVTLSLEELLSKVGLDNLQKSNNVDTKLLGDPVWNSLTREITYTIAFTKDVASSKVKVVLHGYKNVHIQNIQSITIDQIVAAVTRAYQISDGNTANEWIALTKISPNGDYVFKNVTINVADQNYYLDLKVENVSKIKTGTSKSVNLTWISAKKAGGSKEYIGHVDPTATKTGTIKIENKFLTLEERYRKTITTLDEYLLKIASTKIEHEITNEHPPQNFPNHMTNIDFSNLFNKYQHEIYKKINDLHGSDDLDKFRPSTTHFEFKSNDSVNKKDDRYVEFFVKFKYHWQDDKGLSHTATTSQSLLVKFVYTKDPGTTF